MTFTNLPALVQRPSLNYSPTPIAHDLVVVHRTEGGYAGSVAWLCSHLAQASAHLVMKADGAEVSQLVPLGMKAWAQCAFNSRGISLEIEGFTAQGLTDETARAAAAIVAWACHVYGIPPVWAQGGQGRGVCCHHDLGAAGGGHVDICAVGDATWLGFMGFVKEAYDAFGTEPLPDWALHGLPAPHVAQLPPAVTPEPSHGGAARNEPDDMNLHPTVSTFPLMSIADLQYRLKKVGANPTLATDGDEGAATRAAIGVFQKAVGLPVTDDVNPATWAELQAMTG